MDPAGSMEPVSLLTATVMAFPPAFSGAGSAVTHPGSTQAQARANIKNTAVIRFFIFIVSFSYIWDVIRYALLRRPLCSSE